MKINRFIGHKTYSDLLVGNKLPWPNLVWSVFFGHANRLRLDETRTSLAECDLLSACVRLMLRELTYSHKLVQTRAPFMFTELMYASKLVNKHEFFHKRVV